MLSVLVHETLFVFFGSSAVTAAAAIVGADPRRVAPTIGAIAAGSLTLASYVSEGRDAANVSLTAGFAGVGLAVALAFWMHWRRGR